MLLDELSWPDIEEYLIRHQIIIVPLGATEQHGPGLPLGTDTLIARGLAEAVGRAAGRLVGPPLAPGLSLCPHMQFPGTVSFMPDTLTAMIRDYVASLHRHGFRLFLFVNGHGGNEPSIRNAMSEMRYRLDDIRFRWADWWSMPELLARLEKVGPYAAGHAGAAEAALVMHLHPGLARPERFAADVNGRPFLVSNNLAGRFMTRNGLMDADPAGASEQLGRELFDLAVASYLKMLEEMETARG